MRSKPEMLVAGVGIIGVSRLWRLLGAGAAVRLVDSMTIVWEVKDHRCERRAAVDADEALAGFD